MPGEGGQTTSQPPGQRNSGSVVDRVSLNGSLASQAYISTNDALSALLFTCITAARSSDLNASSIPRTSAPNSTSQPHALPRTLPLAVTVSGRRLLTPPLPETYIGNVSLFCHLNIPLPPLHPLTKAPHTTPMSPMRTTSQSDPSHQPSHARAYPAITPDIPTMAGVASRIRARLLELDETYVSGLIGALSRVGDVASVKPACRRFAAGAAGAGAPILGQGRDDGGDVSLTGAVGVSLAGETEGGEGSCSSSSSSSWDLMITPWTAQGFHAMDWGAELLGGRRGGLRSGKNGGDEAHDEGGVGSAGVRSMGRCEAVRIPKVRWEALDGIFIVLPMLEGNEETGGLEVMVGLERGVMERLKEMEEWREWAVWRCD